MATWKTTMGFALAGVMLAGPAFAQATTGTFVTGAETKDGLKSDTRTRSSVPRARKSGAAIGGDEMVKAAQQALRDKGHDPGSVDGRMGPKTQQALRAFQNAQGIAATGQLDAKTMVSLGVEPATTSSAGEASTAGSASPATDTDTAGSAVVADGSKDATSDATK